MDKAEKILLALRREHPFVDNVYFGLGVICVFRDETEKGIHYFEKAIELSPDYVEAWHNKGSLHQKRLEIDLMVKSYRKVVELGNESEDFVKHAKEILDDMEASIRKDKNMTFDEYADSMSFFKDAFAAMEKSDWDKAISGFTRVLSFDPKHTQTYGNLGICYAQLGRKLEALDHFDRALELDPKYGPAITNRQLVELLEEGEKLPAQHTTTEYYKEMAKKSPAKKGRAKFLD
ncbi:MAG: tetratricopeptide repeat protein [Bacteroidales bacterium]|nr:tetratricopeptide repeat protein [Bacteroidales bacterium]MCF8456370.1 tetratricopeptide repeat protein [Bacteroidales bacterium]